MPAPPGILNKVKFLRNLSKSPNPNEAEAARLASEKLIAKFNISDQELEKMEDKPLYGESELLYHTFSIVGWMNRLSLAIAKHFDCYIVQEQLTAVTGEREFNYYVYGGDDEEEYVKFAFSAFLKRIHQFLDTKCLGRGPIYQDSYSEGLVEAIKQNIEMDGIEIPKIKRVPRKIDKQEVSKEAITAPTKKEQPHQDKVDVMGQSLIKDIHAYYKGILDGQDLSLSDILELEVENQTAEQLSK
jgi:hypothetical protein